MSFLFFALKHRLWVLIRTNHAEAVLTCTHTLCFVQKQVKYKKESSNIIFTAFKNLCIMHGNVCVMCYLVTGVCLKMKKKKKKKTCLLEFLLQETIIQVLYHKVPKFSDARNFAVIHLKFKQRGQT